MKVRTMLLCQIFLLIGSSAVGASFKSCKVAERTKLRMFREVIEVGSIAVLRNGSTVKLNDILSDRMIHFKSIDGMISNSYQWMYNSIHKVEGMDKYLSNSYGEDVIITIAYDQRLQTIIEYVGTNSGNYLTLNCE